MGYIACCPAFQQLRRLFGRPIEIHITISIDYCRKNQGYNIYHDARKGAKTAILDIKKHNPRCKFLFYMNARLDMTGRYFGTGNNLFSHHRHDDWILKADDGRPIILRDLYSFDLSVEACREWWLKFTGDAIDYSAANGCFIDALQKYFGDKYRNKPGQID